MEVGFNLIIGILVTLLFSGFFSGMEIAFVSSNRMLAEMDKDKNKNGVSQRLVSLFYSHPNGFVSTMLVGNNIALVVYGILIARLFDNTIFRGMDAAFTVPADTILSTIIVHLLKFPLDHPDHSPSHKVYYNLHLHDTVRAARICGYSRHNNTAHPN